MNIDDIQKILLIKNNKLTTKINKIKKKYFIYIHQMEKIKKKIKI